jgi:hypothetical protein
VWTAHIGSVTDCSQITGAALKIAGARDPDFGPAAVNPGPRPGCGNPGNPVACHTPGPGPTPTPTPTPTTALQAKNALNATLKAAATKLRKLGIHGLLSHRHVAVAYTAPAAGVLNVSLARSAVRLATGKRPFVAAGTKLVTLKLTAKGLTRIRKMHSLKATLKGTFTPTGGSPVTVTRGVSLKR